MRCFMYLISVLITITYSIQSAEYFYPVASYNNGTTTLVLQQQSLYNIQLLSWNQQTNHVEEGLWSLFNPAGLQLLPDESGFSFIDNGRLRIKYFNKRSAQTIDFDRYFYMLSLINWINSQECYCSAKTLDYYSIFHCTTDGYSCCIASSNEGNCLYPQKINSHLFYIEESYNPSTNQPIYCIKHMLYPTILYNDTYSYVQTPNKVRKIIDFQDNPLIFLQMISETQGFVIEHARKIDNNNTVSTFSYHSLIQNNNSWKSQLLFSFDIPIYLFTPYSEECLYESLLPLIPRVIGTKIYFVDATHNVNNHLESYTYDLQTTVIQKNENIKLNSFVPMICGKNIVYGGIMKNINNLQSFHFLT